MRCGVEHVVHPTKGNVQQQRKCWGCGDVGHCLWACPKKAVCPLEGKVQQRVVRRTELEKMIREVKCVKCGRKGINMVWIPESVARDRMCPSCKKLKGRRIEMARPKQLKRSWWKEEEEARNQGWLRSQSERGWITDRWVVTIAECVDCGTKGKWEEPDQGRGHLPIEFFKNNWCPECQENWEAGQWEVSRGNATKVQCRECGKIDVVPERLRMEEINNMKCAQCGEEEREKKREVA